MAFVEQARDLAANYSPQFTPPAGVLMWALREPAIPLTIQLVS